MTDQNQIEEFFKDLHKTLEEKKQNQKQTLEALDRIEAAFLTKIEDQRENYPSMGNNK